MGGFPAARITDTTAHGGKVVVGFPTVLIGGLPASRIGDMHVCPMVTGIVPHVGGPFVLGAFNVLVGFVPQSRVTDMLVCVGPPDTLAMGQSNVLVGMMGAMGMFGLVMGGLMAGLANMAGGYPKSVVDSDGNVVTEYNSQITIKGDPGTQASPEYQASVVSDLNKFLSLPTGQRWADAYAKTGRHISIQPIKPGDQQYNGFAKWSPDSAYNDSLRQPDGKPGSGTDAVISYNPSNTFDYKADDGTTQTAKPYQILGHEMIHSLHFAQGTSLNNTAVNGLYGNQEEQQTMGTNGHDSDITEKSLEGDVGQSFRPNHDTSDLVSSQFQDSDGNWNQGDGIDDHGNLINGRCIQPPVGGAPNH